MPEGALRPFLQKGDADFNRKLAAARRRVREMDAVDGSCVADDSPDSALRTIILALAAGLQGDGSCSFDALAMLEQLEFRVRKAIKVPE